MKRVTLTLLLAVTTHLTVSAQSRDTTQRIDELFSHWNNATPGASVAISRKSKILYKKSFGLADLEHLAPNTTETIFECGSVSKQFTAMSILLLAKDGRLNLFEFIQSKQGTVTGLLVSQSRAERVRFVKTSKDK